MDDEDPMRMRDQPALTRSSGLVWLVVGGLLALISLAVLVPMAVLGLPPTPIAGAAAAVIAVLYAAMLLVRARIEGGRARLTGLAALMIAIAVVALVAVLIVGFSATGVGQAG